MSARDRLDAVLSTNAEDAGCAETFALVHVYAEIVLGGGDPEAQMPGITAHLAQCPPCGEDFLGLLAALRAEMRPDPTAR